jgi:hypothetical protein
MKFYEWLDEGREALPWHADVYVSYMRLQRLTVLWPFNYLVSLWIWMDHKFNEYRFGPSIIDKEIRAALKYEQRR